MGIALSSCRRRSPGFDSLGIPGEYIWDGLDEERIEEYLVAKEDACEEHGADFMAHIPAQTKELLKNLLLRRAVALVHVLIPIEENRRSMAKMQDKGVLPENHYASFQAADEACQSEWKCIMEESQVLAPEAPPNSIIQSAVQLYRQSEARQQAGDEEGGGQFENVKKGFFNNASSSKGSQTAHGFDIGADVVAFGLQTAALNGARGQVVAEKADRVAVKFPAPIGEKALKPANLRLLPPAPKIHPDAREPPVTQFHCKLDRETGESLGLSLSHEPPLAEQQPGDESCLTIDNVLPGGYAKKYNDLQQDPDNRLRSDDRILAVVDGSLPQEQRTPVGGTSQAILEVITRGKTPLILMIGRVLGPPLRFKVGQQVKANLGERGYVAGCVKAVWAASDNGAPPVPYVIALTFPNGDVSTVSAPQDNDDFVKRGDPRFAVGDQVMCHHGDDFTYKQSTITQVHSKPSHIAYSLKLSDANGGDDLEAPDDLNMFLQPVARFVKGTKVFAKVESDFVPGHIEACYHPDWVYAIRLDAGNVVFASMDIDTMVKKR